MNSFLFTTESRRSLRKKLNHFLSLPVLCDSVVKNCLIVSVLLIAFLSACKKDEPAPQDKIRQMLTYRSLGIAHLEESRLADAEKEFKLLIDLAPEEALGHANLGLTYLRMSHYAEAEKHTRKALQLSDEPEIHLILAEILERSGKPEEAKQELQKSVQKFPR